MWQQSCFPQVTYTLYLLFVKGLEERGVSTFDAFNFLSYSFIWKAAGCFYCIGWLPYSSTLEHDCVHSATQLLLALVISLWSATAQVVTCIENKASWFVAYASKAKWAWITEFEWVGSVFETFILELSWVLGDFLAFQNKCCVHLYALCHHIPAPLICNKSASGRESLPWGCLRWREQK